MIVPSCLSQPLAGLDARALSGSGSGRLERVPGTRRHGTRARLHRQKRTRRAGSCGDRRRRAQLPCDSAEPCRASPIGPNRTRLASCPRHLPHGARSVSALVTGKWPEHQWAPRIGFCDTHRNFRDPGLGPYLRTRRVTWSVHKLPRHPFTETSEHAQPLRAAPPTLPCMQRALWARDDK